MRKILDTTSAKCEINPTSSTRWETEVEGRWTSGDLDTTQVAITVEEAIRRGRLLDPGTRDTDRLLSGLDLIRD